MKPINTLCGQNAELRFEVLTAASIKMAVFWVVAPCSLVEIYRLSEVLAASIIRAMIASTSETLVNSYQTTRRNTPEDSHFQNAELLIVKVGGAYTVELQGKQKNIRVIENSSKINTFFLLVFKLNLHQAYVL
jgi:hypothetical protein